MSQKKTDRLVILSIIIFICIFFMSTGTLTSGFHFVDDHEIIRIKHDLNEITPADVIKTWINEDIHSTARFRPLYFLHRITETMIFGDNFVLWSLYNVFLFCITLAAFYSGMRKSGFGIIESLIFLVITFSGPQTEIWWRLGPQESLGMMFISLAFFFMTKSMDCQTDVMKKYQFNNLIFSILLILASLCKESFLIIVPAFVILKIWREMDNKWGSLQESLKKNLVLILPSGIITIELLFIYFRVGTINSGLNNGLYSILSNSIHVTLSFIKNYKYLFAVLVILIVYSSIMNRRISGINPAFLIFFLLVLVPNILLYSHIGLVDRYLLPSAMGLAILAVVPLKDMVRPAGIKYAATILILISLFPHFKASVNNALLFASDGKETGRLLENISGNFKDGEKVVVFADPVSSYESSVSLKYYLNLKSNIDLYGQYVLIPGDSSENPGYLEGWKSYFNGRQLTDLRTKPDLLIFFDHTILDHLLQTNESYRTDYNKVYSGNSGYTLLKIKQENSN